MLCDMVQYFKVVQSLIVSTWPQHVFASTTIVVFQYVRWSLWNNCGQWFVSYSDPSNQFWHLQKSWCIESQLCVFELQNWGMWPLFPTCRYFCRLKTSYQVSLHQSHVRLCVTRSAWSKSHQNSCWSSLLRYDQDWMAILPFARHFRGRRWSQPPSSWLSSWCFCSSWYTNSWWTRPPALFSHCIWCRPLDGNQAQQPLHRHSCRPFANPMASTQKTICKLYGHLDTEAWHGYSHLYTI